MYAGRAIQKGAFVVFKLDSLKQEIFSSAKNLIDFEPTMYQGINSVLLTEYFGDDFRRFKECFSSRDLKGMLQLLDEKGFQIIDDAQKVENEDFTKHIRGLITRGALNNNGKYVDQTTQVRYTKDEYKEPLRELAILVKGITTRNFMIQRFKSTTKMVYIFNGVLLGLLLSGFFLIPELSYYSIESLKIGSTKLLLAGWALSIISLGSIIFYLVQSLTGNT